MLFFILNFTRPYRKRPGLCVPIIIGRELTLCPPGITPRLSAWLMFVCPATLAQPVPHLRENPMLAVRHFSNTLKHKCPQPGVTNFMVLNDFGKLKSIILQNFCRSVIFRRCFGSNCYCWICLL